MVSGSELIKLLLFMFYFIICVSVEFLLDTEFDISYYYIMLSSAAVIAIHSIYYFFKSKNYKKMEKGRLILKLSLVCIITCFMSYNFVFFVNSLSYKSNEITLTGVISEKKTTVSGKQEIYKITLINNSLHRPLKLNISKSEYNSLIVGEAYSRKWLIGPLGLVYWKKWKMA